MLNDELDFVKLQLDVNYDYVDKFVITESGQTYSGNKKENHFYKNRDAFSKYNDKIILRPADSVLNPSNNFDFWPEKWVSI